MDPLEDALGKLLNDPGAMAQVMSLAQSLGAALPQEKETEPAPPKPDRALAPPPNNSRQIALLRALEAYLPPKRQEKLTKALQIARLSSLASAALGRSDREE